MLKIVLISVMSIYGFVYLILGVKTGKPFKTIFLFGFLGILSILLINVSSKFTGINIPINWYSIGLGGTFGPPGVVFLLILRLIFI